LALAKVFLRKLLAKVTFASNLHDSINYLFVFVYLFIVFYHNHGNHRVYKLISKSDALI